MRILRGTCSIAIQWNKLAQALSGHRVKNRENRGTGAVIRDIIIGAIDRTHRYALAKSPDPFLPGQRAVFVQDSAVEEGGVPFCAIRAWRNCAVFESGVVVGDMLGAGAGVVGWEEGLVHDASVLAGGVGEVPLLPAQAGFVEGNAGQDIGIPFCAIRTWRNCAIFKCGVVKRHLLGARAIVVLFEVCLVDHAHVDAFGSGEVIDLPGLT